MIVDLLACLCNTILKSRSRCFKLKLVFVFVFVITYVLGVSRATRALLSHSLTQTLTVETTQRRDDQHRRGRLFRRQLDDRRLLPRREDLDHSERGGRSHNARSARPQRIRVLGRSARQAEPHPQRQEHRLVRQALRWPPRDRPRLQGLDAASRLSGSASNDM